MIIILILLAALGSISGKSCPGAANPHPYRSFAVVKFGSRPVFTATIISFTFVLTIDKFYSEDNDRDDIRVAINFSGTGNERVIRDIEDIIHLPDELSNFALLRLKNPITFTNDVEKARLESGDEVTEGIATLFCWSERISGDVKREFIEYQVVPPATCELHRRRQNYPDNYLCFKRLHTTSHSCAAGSFGGGIFVEGFLVAIVDSIPRDRQEPNVIEFYPRISRADKDWIGHKIDSSSNSSD